MTKTMPLALLLAVGACAGPAATPPASGPISPALLAALSQAVGRMPQKDQVYSGTIVLAGRVLPLPPGEWVASFTGLEVSGVQVGSAATGVGGTVFLIQRRGQALSRVLNLQASSIDHHVANSIPVSGPCSSSDVLRSDVRSASGNDAQDCVSVYFFQQSAARAAFKAAWPSVDALNLVIPPIFVGGSVRLVAPDVAVAADLVTNPDLEGIAVDAEPNRLLNGWSRDRLAKDAAKRGYVDRLDAAMEAYRATLLGALKQATPVPAASTPGVLPGPGAGGPIKT